MFARRFSMSQNIPAAILAFLVLVLIVGAGVGFLVEAPT
jgi:hypothetical protein